MAKIVECVPNFSEGKDMAVIEKITDEIKSVENVTLLDVDSGMNTNRTVVTFVGDPDGVVEAAFLAIKKASELIDMRNHTGAHPRMGATDVCPFIPVSDVTNEECVALSKKLGAKVGKELGIPIFLYGKSASRLTRRNLPDIRKGEYEALPEKFKNPEFQPDFGKLEFNAKSGATAVGVRDFMLAYNINLNTTDISIAKDIALTIREKGRAKRDKDGEIIRDEYGKAVKIPGKLKYCQAGGWFIDEYGYAQVTMNLHDPSHTGLHTAFDVVSKEAERKGVRVTGSELVGLVPKQALLDSGIHYLKKQGRNIGIPERDIIHIAVLSLGLNDTSPFTVEERIVEYAIENKGNRLIDKTVEDFVNELSSDSPAPGGGSVAALNAAISAGLVSMVANLTFGKKQYKRYYKQMEEISIHAQECMRKALMLVDKDTNAFNDYMSAMRLPKKTDSDKAKRLEAMEEAAKNATLVPLETLKLANEIMDIAEIALKKGNENAASDAGVSAIQACAAAEGAYLNVAINLPMIGDQDFADGILTAAKEVLEEVRRAKTRLFTLAKKRTSEE